MRAIILHVTLEGLHGLHLLPDELPLGRRRSCLPWAAEDGSLHRAHPPELAAGLADDGAEVVLLLVVQIPAHVCKVPRCTAVPAGFVGLQALPLPMIARAASA